MSWIYTYYCACGAAWEGRGPGRMPRETIDGWLRLHSDPGCRETDALTCARARWHAEHDRRLMEATTTTPTT